MQPRSFFDLDDVFRFVPDGRDRHVIRNFNFMNKQQPASVGQLAYGLGFEVRHEKLPATISARLEADTWSEKGFEIVVNKNHARVRQRFSALHEIAHYYLHEPQGDTLSDPSEFKHRSSLSIGIEHVYSQEEHTEEVEANLWADTVIFGQQALVGAVGLFGRNPKILAKHFGFSEQVVLRAMLRRNI